MGIRTAIEHNPVLTFGLLFAIAWTLVVGVTVINRMGSITPDNWVGQHGFGGLMGVLVLGAFLGVVLFAFAALGEPEPAPQEWPPE